MKNKALPNNFGGLPARYSKYQNAAIVVLPVPFDKTSTWVKGSAKGPRAIINASRNMELFDIETASEVYTKGIHTAKNLQAKSSATMVKSVYTKCRAFLDDDKFVITLGGEHTVALGAIQAHTEHFADMSILHLDAHSDMRDSYEGSKFNHACVMARALECSTHRRLFNHGTGFPEF
jgi:agmatinase